MKRVFNPSDELITNEWLRANADSISQHTVATGRPLVLETAIFEVEADDHGYTHLRVDMWEPRSTSVAFEIENGWVTGEDEMQTARVGIGLFSRLDDLKALLEILARGLV